MNKMTISFIITFILLASGMNVLFAQDEEGSGYSAGLNVSYPLVTGSYFDGAGT